MRRSPTVAVALSFALLIPVVAGAQPSSYAPSNIIGALQAQASERPVADTEPCTSGGFGNSTDRAIADTKQEDWSKLKASQRDFSIAFARCAVHAYSRRDFLLLSGATVASLSVAVYADYRMTATSSDFQVTSGSRARIIATWLLADPHVAPSEQKDVRTYLKILDKINLEESPSS